MAKSGKDMLAYYNEQKRQELIHCGVIGPDDPLPCIRPEDIDEMRGASYTAHTVDPLPFPEPKTLEELEADEKQMRKNVEKLRRDPNVFYLDANCGAIEKWRKRLTKS